MIAIEERQTKHIPGLTSLFISFKYKKEIIEIIKNYDVYNYDKKTCEWEIPLTSLTNFLDKACIFDEISIKVIEEKVAKSFESNGNIKLGTYKTKPFEYQKQGIIYGLNHDCFLLLDAPGLGKSLQMILLSYERKKREKIKHCLVICGVNDLKFNWKKEIEKHTNLSCRILGEKTKRDGTVYIGSMKDRLNDLKSNLKEFFIITNVETIRDKDIVSNINKGKNEFDMIVFDEVHHCKTPNTQQTNSLLKLNKAKYRIGLTGTLLINNPLDTYIPMKWIGVERSSYTTFKYHYCIYGGMFNNELIGYKNLEQLKDQLSTCSLRRTKDLLDLPEKNIIHEFVDMNSSQQIFYENIKNGILDQVDKVKMSAANLLSMIARLRQATACPSVLTTENISSSKVDRVIDIVDQVVSNGEKILVFSTFKATVDTLKEKLKKYNPLVCTGDVKESEISDSIDKFQNDSQYRVMLATWQKMGTGITLTAANYCCFVDTPWTSSDCEQAEDRIHRIGSKKPVFIYYLWTNNTIDMRVKELVEDKSIMSSYIVDDKVDDSLRERFYKMIKNS